MDDSSFPRRWRSLLRFRVSLRAMMALVLLLAVVLGWYVRGVHVQWEAVAAIKSAGGSVAYDWEWGTYNSDIVDPNGKPRMPKWLANRVDVDYVANVVYVSLVPRRGTPRNKTDAALAHVGRLGHLEYLVLNSSDATDAGMAHLTGLRRLRGVELWKTRVGDAGLAHLHGLTSLRQVNLAETRVTDDGVLALEKAFPGMMIQSDEDMTFCQAAPRATADLEFARSQPVRLAAALLIHRAKLMVTRGDNAGLVASLDALCDLDADDAPRHAPSAWESWSQPSPRGCRPRCARPPAPVC